MRQGRVSRLDKLLVSAVRTRADALRATATTGPHLMVVNLGAVVQVGPAERAGGAEVQVVGNGLPSTLIMACLPSPAHSAASPRPASLLQLLPLTSCSAAGCRPAAGLHAEAWHTHSMGLQNLQWRAYNHTHAVRCDGQPSCPHPTQGAARGPMPAWPRTRLPARRRVVQGALGRRG